MKNKNQITSADIHENAVIKRDFTFVVILNTLLFALMVGLFFWNRSAGALENLFESVIKF